MPQVTFTANLQRHLPTPRADVPGATVREALEGVFRDHPRLRGYVLDDQGRLRRHVMIFVDGEAIADRDGLAEPVRPDASIYVMQALSGG
ncbi:MAG TPA: MoaD/ThiS family protein [Anaeromyxobacteraceae bacterium]|nr:MoaD/ThiS family protein [Anaeromyxobacteraceae bacterium]